MREITVKLFKFDELDDKAKERARDWFRQGNDGSFEWENVKEDAKSVGIEIVSLWDHHPNGGRFMAGALETAHKIKKEHGESCETFKTTAAFLERRDALVDSADKDENGDMAEEHILADALDELESEYLHDLLEDYRIMLAKENEYANSDETVDENIRCNEYEFTEDGKRA